MYLSFAIKAIAVFACLVWAATSFSASPAADATVGGLQVEDGWVRPTVAGQKSSGAYMTITAREPLRLVGVSSPLAGVAEVHEMKMDGDVMRMRALPRIDLPAGQAVQFRPGGYHVMLMNLKQPLVAGGAVPLTLQVENASGVLGRIELKLPVAVRAPERSLSGLQLPAHVASRPDVPVRR